MKPSRPCALLPSAETIPLSVPKAVARAARRLLAHAKVGQTVAQALALGKKERDTLLSQWLTKARDGKHRFTSRRIARLLEIETYAQTHRAVLAYWVSGNEEDPPPSGAYYTAAPASDVCSRYKAAIDALWREAGIDAELPSQVSVAGHVGTRLIPPDDVVRPLSAHLATAIQVRPDSQDWNSVRRFHNRYVAYVISLLEFATSHRPVGDPFDAPYTVSSAQGLALIDDKNFGQERAVRLVPLCEFARAQLRAYVAHLHGLLPLIPPKRAGFRLDLECQLADPLARDLPLFFFVDAEGNWRSVTGTEMRSHFPAGWNYPLNLHRHLLATWLYRHGIAEEAAAQFLGHVDVGTAGLSLHSPHSPESLFAPLAPSIDAFLAHFGWQPLPGLAAPSGVAVPAPQVDPDKPRRPFGSARRQMERTAQAEADRKQIDLLFANHLAGREEETLTAEDVRALIEAVDALAANRSERRALLRMDALRERLVGIRRAHNLKIPIPHARRVIAHEPSLFSLTSLVKAEAAAERRKAFLTRLDTMHFPLSARTHPHYRGAYALFALIALGRVLDPSLIAKVLLGARYWLIEDPDFGFMLEIQVSRKNIRRYPVGSLVAGLLLDSCFDQANEKGIRREFERLVAEFTGRDKRRNRDSVAKQIALFQEEARLTMPGMLAGYVTGETGAVSLPRQAYLRYRTSRAPIAAKLPVLDDGKDKDHEEEADPLWNEGRAPLPVSGSVGDMALPAGGTASRANALRFVAEADAIMSKVWGTTTDEKGNTRAKSKAPLAPVADAIEKLLRERLGNGTLTPISYVLGRWLVRLCRHGSKQGAVVASTIATYWGTLKLPLSERAHDIPLSELIGTALEEIYSATLDETPYERPHLVLKRLIVFHWFLQQDFGVAAVDWGEVIPENFPSDDLTVDAGLITWDEYRTALRLMESDPHTPDLRDRLLNCMCLIVLFRFGTRISESAGLRIKDVLQDGQQLVIRICNDDFRRVKTDAGIRHVPLLGTFDEREASIFERWMEHIQHCHGDDHLSGLFAERDTARTLVAQWRIASRISDALVTVTGDPDARIHHGRHGFVSRLMMALGMEAQSSLGGPGPGCEQLGFCAERLRKTLLDTATVSRRGAWAAAAIVGHAHPRTTGRYYSHLHDVLCTTLGLVLDPAVSDRQLQNVLDINERSLKNLRIKVGGTAGARDIVRSAGKIAQVDGLVEMPREPILPEARLTRARSSELGLEGTMRVLQTAWPSARLENIANRLLYDPVAIARVLASARAVCENTQFAQPTSSTQDVVVPDPHDLSPAEWRRLVDVARRLEDRRRQADQDMLSAGHLWERGFAPASNVLLLQRESELDAIAGLLDKAGIPRTRWEVRLDNKTRKEPWAKPVFDYARRLGLEVVWIDKLPLFPSAGRRRHLGRRRFGVAILEGNSGPVRSAKAGHRLFFAAATLRRMRQ